MGAVLGLVLLLSAMVRVRVIKHAILSYKLPIVVALV